MRHDDGEPPRLAGLEIIIAIAALMFFGLGVTQAAEPAGEAQQEKLRECLEAAGAETPQQRPAEQQTADSSDTSSSTTLPVAKQDAVQNRARRNIHRLCERIADSFAWQMGVAQPDCKSDDKCPDRQAREMSYLFVDLSPQDEETEGERGTLPVGALVGLLSAPDLLPPYVTGGLILHRAEFTDALMFQRSHIRHGLTLSDTVIRAETVRQDFLGRKPFGDPENPGTVAKQMSVVIEDSIFDKPLIIGPDTDLNGRMLVSKSKLPELAFRRADIGGELEVWRADLGVLGLYETTFENGTYIVDNDLNAVQVRYSIFKKDAIFNSNTVTGRSWFGLSAFNGSSEKVSIYDNDLNGPFSFIKNAAAKEVDEVILGFNRFRSRAEVQVPAANIKTFEDPERTGSFGLWYGDINLIGAVSESELRIRAAGADDSSDASKAYCSREGGAERPFASRHRTVRFDFTGANIRVVNWQQTPDCNLRWSGRGFRYKLFDPAGDDPFERAADSAATRAKAGTNSQARIRTLREWVAALRRDDLPTSETVDPLTYASQYLKTQGYRAEARDVLEEAKEADYRVWSAGFLPREMFTGALWLGGYGAKPERALYSLLVLWAMGAVVYGGYSWAYKRFVGWGPGSTPPTATRWWFVKHEQATQSSFPGFLMVDEKMSPKMMRASQYSLDAIVPIFNLYAYDRFYPAFNPIRYFALLQHVAGIVLWGVLITTWAIL